MFNKNMTIEEFKHIYYYKTDLQEICRQLGLPSIGTKAELEKYIILFLKGVDKRDIINKRQSGNTTRNKKQLIEITLDTKIIQDGFKLNNQARDFFKNYFNVDKFSFTKSMAVLIRKAEENNDFKMTVGDLVDVYINGYNDIESTDEERTYQWNNFVKSFNADDISKSFNNKMKVASILWKKVKNCNVEKVYSRELIDKYFHEIKSYMK